MKTPLAPKEAVEAAFRQVEDLLAISLCESCALRYVATKHGLRYDRLLVLWLERERHGSPN